MTTEIFADSLFIVNFTMDFLSLFITAKALRAKLRPLRLAAAAILGAVFATLMVVFYRDELLLKIIWWLAFVSCAAAMCAIAYDGRIWKAVPVFAAANLGLGGLMSVLYSYLRTRTVDFNGSSPGGLIADAGSASGELSPLVFLLFAIISGVVSLVYGRIRQSTVKRRDIEAEIEIFGQPKKLKLLVDSGNLLREPMSGRPAIVVEAAKLSDILPAELLGVGTPDLSSLPDTLARRIRLIPAKSVIGGGLMTGILPDKVTVNGRAVEAIIALSGETFDDCDGILPELLLI